MNLLAAKLYDPSSAASQVTTSLLAMTALDTTNLRLGFTVPASGFVRVKQSIVHTGSTTSPQVLLGILEGATVRARVACNANLLQTAIATSQIRLEADYVVAGMTPGASVNWDFAVGVEIVASASGALKWGGPNNTTTNDAWGAVVFEIWDPQPKTTTGQLSVDANGRVDLIKVAGTTQTARDLGASVLLSSGTGTGQLDFTSGVVKANAVQLLGTAWLTPGTAGTPDVNAKLWNGLTTVALPLTPTTAGRTLDVSATGEAGVDWANVGSPTTTLNLSGTTIATTQKVDVETIKTNPVVNGGTITFPSGATLASVTGAVGSVTGAVGSVAGAVGSVTGLTAADVGAIKAKTDSLTFTTAGKVDATFNVAGDIPAGVCNKIADHTLRRTYANARASSDGDAVAFRSTLGAVGKLVNRWEVTGATLKLYQEDDTTFTAPGGTQTITGAAGAIVGLDTN